MNVEVGAEAMTATAVVVQSRVVGEIVLRMVPVMISQNPAPTSAFLRSGRSSQSAIPGDNYILDGGEAVLV